MDNNVLFHKKWLYSKNIMAEYLNNMDITDNPKIKENNIDLHKILWILRENYGFQHNNGDIHIDLGQTCFRCVYCPRIWLTDN